MGQKDLFSRDNSEGKKETTSLEVRSLNCKGPANDLEHQFDTYCKKLLKNEAKDGYKEERRKWENETPFSGLSEQELSQLQTLDEYPAEFYRFDVLGEAIEIKNEILGSALKALPEHRRMITLLAYFFDLSDVKISTLLKVGRRAVQYQRQQSLKEIKLHMEENRNDE